MSSGLLLTSNDRFAVRLKPLSPVMVRISVYMLAASPILGRILTVAMLLGAMLDVLSAVLISKPEPAPPASEADRLMIVPVPVFIIVNSCGVCVVYPAMDAGKVQLFGLIIAVYDSASTVNDKLTVRLIPVSPVIVNVSVYVLAASPALGRILTVAVLFGAMVRVLRAVLISKP